MGLYFLFALPPLLLAMYAQSALKSNYKEAQSTACTITGAAAARAILDSAGLSNVKIERIPGELSDHYDPRAKVLRLSDNSYNGHNLAALGVAAHESGHALQDAQRYKLMVIRQLAVPLASFGSNSAMICIILGGILRLTPLLALGVIGFGLVALFQIINLPVEYNASSRARIQLESLRFLKSHEEPIVKKMLNAAALTYVAGLLAAISQFLYYLFILLGNQNKR